MELHAAPAARGSTRRAIAIAERDGPEQALSELAKLEDTDRLRPYPFFHAALGELTLRLGRYQQARAHFEAALERARNDTERRFLRKRLAEAAH